MLTKVFWLPFSRSFGSSAFWSLDSRKDRSLRSWSGALRRGRHYNLADTVELHTIESNHRFSTTPLLRLTPYDSWFPPGPPHPLSFGFGVTMFRLKNVLYHIPRSKSDYHL